MATKIPFSDHAANASSSAEMSDIYKQNEVFLTHLVPILIKLDAECRCHGLLDLAVHFADALDVLEERLIGSLPPKIPNNL